MMRFGHLGNSTRLMPAPCDGVKCSGCWHVIPLGERVAYFAEAERGQRLWHPGCVEADPATLLVKRTAAEAEKAAQEHLRRRTEDSALVRRDAVKDALQAALAWLQAPGMEQVADFVVDRLQEAKAMRILYPERKQPLTPPVLRVINGADQGESETLRELKISVRKWVQIPNCIR